MCVCECLCSDFDSLMMIISNDYCAAGPAALSQQSLALDAAQPRTPAWSSCCRLGRTPRAAAAMPFLTCICYIAPLCIYLPDTECKCKLLKRWSSSGVFTMNESGDAALSPEAAGKAGGLGMPAAAAAAAAAAGSGSLLPYPQCYADMRLSLFLRAVPAAAALWPQAMQRPEAAGQAACLRPWDGYCCCHGISV
jgi:hypothetical protein